MWNIERIVKKGDYLYAVVPEHPKATKNGYVLEHRVVVENEIGRLLKDNEEVHHIDGNKHNNLPKNLEIKLRGEHQRFHAKKRYPNGEAVLELICTNCKKKFTRNANQRPELKGYKNAFCSRSCNGKFNGFKRKSN